MPLKISPQPPTKVSLGPSDASFAQAQPISTASRFKTCGAKMLDTWLAMQLTNYGGKYSIERMLALDEYIQQTSLQRVLLVIVATPVPVVAVVVAQESVPLQDPAEGWDVNYGFWIRLGILSTMSAYGAMKHLPGMVNEATMSRRQLAVFCLFSSTLYVGVAMVLAAGWAFPLPFAVLSMSIPFGVVMIGSLWLVMGTATLRQIAQQREQLRQFNKFAAVQTSMTILYPAYQVMFLAAANTRWEIPMLLVLPVMKLVMKNLFVRTFTGQEDLAPECVIFTIDFYDALYLATCIQSVTSVTSVVVITSRAPPLRGGWTVFGHSRKWRPPSLRFGGLISPIQNVNVVRKSVPCGV